jgi:hypothetical protein
MSDAVAPDDTGASAVGTGYADDSGAPRPWMRGTYQGFLSPSLATSLAQDTANNAEAAPDPGHHHSCGCGRSGGVGVFLVLAVAGLLYANRRNF